MRAMAVDYFLKIDGIEGESTDKKHAKEIDVDAWTWGESQTGSSERPEAAAARARSRCRTSPS